MNPAHIEVLFGTISKVCEMAGFTAMREALVSIPGRWQVTAGRNVVTAEERELTIGAEIEVRVDPRVWSRGLGFVAPTDPRDDVARAYGIFVMDAVSVHTLLRSPAINTELSDFLARTDVASRFARIASDIERMIRSRLLASSQDVGEACLKERT
jgi:hypothetical protein